MPSRIIRRATWGATGRDGFGSRPIPAAHVFAHHTVTVAPSAEATVAQDIAAVKVIERIGNQRFGSISYNFLIPPSGRIFEGVSVGRIGAHTSGYNTTGIGISLIGNYMTRPATPAQREAFAWLLRHLREVGALAPTARLRGHNAVSATACPGALVAPALAGIEAESRKVAAPVPAPVPTPAPVSPATTVGAMLVRVKSATLNVRAGVGTGHPVTTTVRRGEVFTIVETARSADGGTWGRLKSGAGWINIGPAYVDRVGGLAFSTLVAPKPAPAYLTVRTNGAALMLRASASQSARILARIPNGHRVELVSRGGAWHRVRYGGAVGYVSANWVK